MDIYKYLIEDLGIDKHSPNKKGQILLSLAAMEGHLPIVSYLLEVNSKYHDYTINMLTPLHHAAYNGHLHIVKYLMESKPNMYFSSPSASPLHSAASNGSLSILLKTDNVILMLLTRMVILPCIKLLSTDIQK